MKYLLLLLAMCVGLSAQVFPTAVSPSQLPTSTTVLGFWVNVPGVGFTLVQLDQTALKVDFTTTPPTLRVISTVAVPQVNRDILTPVINTSTVSITKASYILSTLHVYKNGLIQYQGGDYTVTGTVVTLKIPTGTDHDVIQLEYSF